MDIEFQCCPLQDMNRKSTTVVESWEGSKERQSYTHVMTKNASVSYTWAFQRTKQAQDVSVEHCKGLWDTTIQVMPGG